MSCHSLSNRDPVGGKESQKLSMARAPPIGKGNQSNGVFNTTAIITRRSISISLHSSKSSTPLHRIQVAVGGKMTKCVLRILVCALLGTLAAIVGGQCTTTPSSSGGVLIPATWSSVADGAFRACGDVRSVSFESGSQLMSIGRSAFSHSGLTSIELPTSLVSIGDFSFNNCGKLHSVSFESGSSQSQLTSIGRSAFSHSGLILNALPGIIVSITKEMQLTNASTPLLREEPPSDYLASSEKEKGEVQSNLFSGQVVDKCLRAGDNAAVPNIGDTRGVNITRSAVCLVGFDGGKMALASMKALVLERLGADLFLASTDDSEENLVEFFDQKSPRWRNSSFLKSEFGGTNYLDGLPGFHTPKNSRCAYQLKERFSCLDLIRSAEISGGYVYDHIGIGRHDLFWLKEHPTVCVGGNECWIPCEENDWGGYCDHWAFCGRQAFESYVSSPFRLLPIVTKEDWGNPTPKTFNIETLLRLSLQKENVRVKRGVADFFRSCRKKGETRYPCEDLPSIGAFGKPSSGQVARANQLLKDEPGLAQYILGLG